MPFVKGQKSANPSGRPKIHGSIRAMARCASHAAFARLEKESLNEDARIAVPACVNILKIAGVSFASDAEETKAQIEVSKATGAPTPTLEDHAGSPELPLN